MDSSVYYAKAATAMYRPVAKTKKEKPAALQSHFIFRYDAAKRNTVCCTVFFISYFIRKTRIVCL